MKCPFCSSDQSSVIDKRAVRTTSEIRRRRECIKCKRRYTTYERVSTFELFVLKRDGRREEFSREKLRSGIQKSLEKRPGIEKVDLIVDKIAKSLTKKGKSEVDSKVIGKMVLAELKKLDQIAYLRFASVYREFKDPEDFQKELESLNF